LAAASSPLAPPPPLPSPDIMLTPNMVLLVLYMGLEWVGIFNMVEPIDAEVASPPLTGIPDWPTDEIEGAPSPTMKLGGNPLEIGPETAAVVEDAGVEIEGGATDTLEGIRKASPILDEGPTRFLYAAVKSGDE
jgi:hypothetical protein